MDHTTYQHQAPEIDPRFSPQSNSSLPFPQESFYTTPNVINKQGDGMSYGYGGHGYPGHSSYGSSDAKEATVFMQGDRAEVKPERRRCCGMRRGVFICLLAVIILLVIAGVVLGVVFGVILPGRDDSSGSTVMHKTGLATAKAADDNGKLYVYFQDPDGSIRENVLIHGEWSSDDSGNTDEGVVTTAAAKKSPLAAISYQYNGDAYRQLFFLTGSGSVKTVNRTETRGWSSPRRITRDISAVGTIALAACADEDLGAHGIHVFYGSQLGLIVEVGGQLDGSGWDPLHYFPKSDERSGVACTIGSNYQGKFINLYFRDASYSTLVQWYKYIGTPWRLGGLQAPSNRPLAAGSDIAICDDDRGTDYIFYQRENGAVIRGVLIPNGIHFQTIKNVQHTDSASVGSKLAASYVDGGSFLLYQDTSSLSEVSTIGQSRDGGLISDDMMSG